VEKLYEFEKARMWLVTESAEEKEQSDWSYDEWRDTIYIEALGHPHVLMYQAYDEDGYRSHLIANTRSRLEFAMLPKRQLIGEFEEMEVFMEDAENTKRKKNDREYTPYEFIRYNIYSKGNLIATAEVDMSDDYYPSAGINIITENEYERVMQLAEKEMFYEQGKVMPEVKDKKAMIVVGEPRTGKTKTLCNYGKIEKTIDTDVYMNAKGALRSAEAIRENAVFVIGKYRNTIVKTAEGDLAFKDMVAKILEKKGYEVCILEFVERKGAEYLGYSIIIDNQTNEKLDDWFQDTSKEKGIGLVSEKKGYLPKDSYIYAVLKKTV